MHFFSKKIFYYKFGWYLHLLAKNLGMKQCFSLKEIEMYMVYALQECKEYSIEGEDLTPTTTKDLKITQLIWCNFD
jgi:hypothetical protein